MVSKKISSETSQINMTIMGCECIDKIVPLIEKRPQLVQIFNEISLCLPIDVEEKEQMITVFYSDNEGYFSEKTESILKNVTKFENDYITIPVKMYVCSMMRMGMVGKIYVNSEQETVNYINSSMKNICGCNLASDTDVEVTPLDVAMFARMMMDERMYLFVDSYYNLSFMDIQSIQEGLEYEGLEGNIINAFYDVDGYTEEFGGEWKDFIKFLRAAKNDVYKNGELDKEKLLSQIEKAMSIVPKGSITIDYNNNSPEYITHKFKTEDMNSYKELQEYVENEGSGCGRIGKETFKGKTTAIIGSKKIKLKEDKKRKK